MANTNATMTEPPRASFLGLPVELRLHIYRWIVDVPGSKRRPIQRLGWCGSTTASIICTGAGPDKILRHETSQIGDLSLLAANKQIFAEATPVMYQHFEIGTCIDRVPLYARAFVEKVLILCDMDYQEYYRIPSVRPTGSSPENGDLSDVVRVLGERFPRLRQVRVHVYTSVGSDNYELAMLHPLKGLTAIGKLEKIIVASHVQGLGRHRDHTARIKRIRHHIASNVREEAKRESRDITVIEEELDCTSCVVCLKGSCEYEELM